MRKNVYICGRNDKIMAKKQYIFSLFDFCKNADKVQVFDEYTLDDEGNIIPFIDQAALITHYLQLMHDDRLELPYRDQAEGILRLWYDFVRGEHRPKDIPADRVAEDGNALQAYLFADLFRAPFPAPAWHSRIWVESVYFPRNGTSKQNVLIMPITETFRLGTLQRKVRKQRFLQALIFCVQVSLVKHSLWQENVVALLKLEARYFLTLLKS